MDANLSANARIVKPPPLRKVPHKLYRKRCYALADKLPEGTHESLRAMVAYVAGLASGSQSYYQHNGFALVSGDLIRAKFKLSNGAAWDRIRHLKLTGFFEFKRGGGKGGQGTANRFRPIDPETKVPLIFREVEAVEPGRVHAAAFAAGLDVDRVEAFAAFWAAHVHAHNPERTARAFAEAVKAGAEPARLQARAEAWAEVEGCAPAYTWLERRHYERKPRTKAEKPRRRRAAAHAGRRDPLYLKAVKLFGRGPAAAIKADIANARGAERRAIEAVLDNEARYVPTVAEPCTAERARWFIAKAREDMAKERAARIEPGVA